MHRLTRTMTLLILCVALAIVATGCAVKSSQASDEATPVRRSARPADLPQPDFPEFATPDQARDKVAFEVRKPMDTLGQQLKKVVVRDRKDNERFLPKHKRAVDLIYDSIEIAQAPFEDGEAAQRYVRNLTEQPLTGENMSAVQVGGHEGLAWDKGELGPKEISGDGRDWVASVPDSGVIWAEGNIVFRVSSQSVASKDLVKVANSMY